MENPSDAVDSGSYAQGTHLCLYVSSGNTYCRCKSGKESMPEQAVRGPLFILYSWIVILYHSTEIIAPGLIKGMSRSIIAWKQHDNGSKRGQIASFI
jgi:hypothetical protein